MEECGFIAIGRVPPDLRKKFKKMRYNIHLASALYVLADHCCISTSHIDNSDVGFDKVHIVSGYVVIEYAGAEWTDLASVITNIAINIEFYSLHMNEYGIEYYFALTKDNKRIVTTIDSECYDEPHSDSDKRKLSIWEDAIPIELKSVFSV